MTEDEAKRLASELTGIPLEALVVSYDSTEDVYCVSELVRGGVRIIVGQDRSVLFVSSAISYEQYTEDFQRGVRTEYVDFEWLREHKTAWYAERAQRDQG